MSFKVSRQMLSPPEIVERLRELFNNSRNDCHDYYVLIIYVPKDPTYWFFSSVTHWISVLFSLERNWAHICWSFVQNLIKNEHNLSKAISRKPPMNRYLCFRKVSPEYCTYAVGPSYVVLCDVLRDLGMG